MVLGATLVLWDKCIAQLFGIFHSSFVSWQINLLSFILATANVCSANENAAEFKASLIFRMKQREKSMLVFFHTGAGAPLCQRHGCCFSELRAERTKLSPWL